MDYGDNVIFLIVHNPHNASYKNMAVTQQQQQ